MSDTPYITVDSRKLKTADDMLRLVRLAMWISHECLDVVGILDVREGKLMGHWLEVKCWYKMSPYDENKFLQSEIETFAAIGV